MGSFNNHPVTETNPGTNQQEVLVITLTNPIYYFIESVFILIGKDFYRLVALKHGRVLCDREYKTLRGCKIAFVKLFKNRTWKEKIKPSWTIDYTPEQQWLKKKGYESRMAQGAGRMGERE